MANDNRISASLSAQDLTDILAAIQTIRTKLPFLVTLTAGERKEMPKLGDKSRGFDEKCAAYMASNPEFLPGFHDITEINKDRALRDPLGDVFGQLKTLTEDVGDTFLVLNSEIWMADLAYYANVKEAKRRGRSGADTIYDDLRPRFPGAAAKPAAPKPTA